MTQEQDKTEQKRDHQVDLGVFARNASQSGMGASEIIALSLSLLWLFGCAVFFLVLGTGGDGEDGMRADPVRLVMTVLAVFMPVAIIWMASAATKSARIMREESARLQAAIDAMRHTYLQQQHSGALGTGASSVERKLDQIAKAQRQTETAIATFTSIRQAAGTISHGETHPVALPATGDSAQDQASLALGTPAESLTPPLSISDFIRAMHFPENADDKEGFRALRRALQDRQVSDLVQAAQDVLTLLSQDGIYMDDLRPDRARTDIWRMFAAGERGRAIAALGGVRDRTSLALAAGRMRKDPIFRDAAHHFLRKFDQTFAMFEKSANDQEIAAMADTRTARAFMLLGRVTGTFD